MSDLIDRQQALEKVRAMQTYKLSEGDDMLLLDKAEVQTELMMLPPAQPEVLACGNGELIAKPEPTYIDAKEAVYNLAEKIGIHQLFALTVELRGEPIQPEPQWIPVSERLPETEEFVLASLSGKYRNTTFEHACEIADYADGEWCVYAYPHMSAEKCEELIEAWMPLPEPYKPNK